MLQVAWPAGPYSCSAIDLRSTAIANALRTLRSEKNGCLVSGSALRAALVRVRVGKVDQAAARRSG